jgi:hypothetical protein
MTEFKDTMEPIIELHYSQLRMEQENEIMRAVQRMDVNVDKERLLQALTDARRFWQEGYEACMEWKPRWISVEERLPETISTYLVVVKFKYDWEKEYEICVDAAVFNPCGDGYIDDCWDTFNDWDEGQQFLHVTHWMPLPEPPEVGG